MNSKPLYKQVIDAFLQKLTVGELSVGDRLPPEAMYAVELGVSRSTLRLAFSQLESVGVIQRRQRGGTEIISAKPLQRFNVTVPGFSSVMRFTRDLVIDLREVKKIHSNDFALLENYNDESPNWLLCVGTRTLPDHTQPFCWLSAYVCERYSDLSIQAGDSTVSIQYLIEQEHGCALSRVKQRYSAASCPPVVAQVLGVAVGSAVTTSIAELFDADGELMLIIESIIDTNKFKILTDVSVAD